MIYTDKVMDHFRNPRNVGEIEDANGIGEVGNAKCGDIMKVYLKVEDNIIKDVKFQTFGCGSAIASNKAVAEALDGLPPVKMHCSVLAEEAIHKAINDYRKNQGLSLEGWEFEETDHDELHDTVHGHE